MLKKKKGNWVLPAGKANLKKSRWIDDASHDMNHSAIHSFIHSLYARIVRDAIMRRVVRVRVGLLRLLVRVHILQVLWVTQQAQFVAFFVFDNW